MAQKPERGEVSIVGPCYSDYGGLGIDHDRRELTVEVTIKGNFLSSEDIVYRIGASTSRFSQEWADPFVRVEAGVVGRSLSIHELEHKLRYMKKLTRYTHSLPVQPQSVAEHVATVLKLHKAAVVRLMAYEDHRTRPHVTDDAALASTAINAVYRAQQSLIPNGDQPA